MQRSGRIDAVWASVTVLAWLGAVAWTLLGVALRSECETDPGCDDWVIADAVAVGLAGLALVVCAVWRRGRRPWLALATASLLVPLVHVLFV